MLSTQQPDRQTPGKDGEQTTLQELRVRRASPVPGMRDAYDELKNHIIQRLEGGLEHQLNQKDKIESRALLQESLDVLLAEENIILKRHERRQLTEDIVAELLGLGPLEPLLALDGISQIMVNGPQEVFIRRYGQLERMDTAFEDDAHVMRIIRRIVAPLGRQVDQDSPVLSARLPDGSHVNIVVPPVSSKGPTITIQRWVRTLFTAQELINLKSLTSDAIDFLRACVLTRLNILISGEVGTGKTTLLGTLCSFIPAEERIVTIEDMAELQLDHAHVVPLEAYLDDGSGNNSITTENLIKTASRMRPDRLILGNIQGSEAFAWLQAINTGLDGSMTTSFASSPQDLLSRLEVMALLAGAMLPQQVIRDQIISAIDLIVHLERLSDGSRKVMSICDVMGFKDDQFVTAEIMKYKQTGGVDDQITSALQPTGIHSYCLQRIQDAGFAYPSSLFDAKAG